MTGIFFPSVSYSVASVPRVIVSFSIHLVTRIFLLATSGNTISFCRLPFNFAYIIRQGYQKEHSAFGSIGRLLLLPADAAGASLLIRKLLFMGVSSAFMGATAVLYMIAYVPIAINAIIVLSSDETCAFHKRQALFDLTVAILQIALATLCLIGYTHPLFFVTLAILAASMGGIAFLHSFLAPSN